MNRRGASVTSAVTMFGGVRTPFPETGLAIPPRVFDAPRLPADPDALARVSEQVNGADLAAPAVVLPDFHHKSKMEMPSSVAVATRDSIRPTLTSSSVNCGMALIALDCDRPDEAAISRFYRSVIERYPYPPTRRLELTYREAVDAANRGAEFAVDRYGVDPGQLERVEESGRLDLERYGGHQRFAKELPSLAFHFARMRFGTVGPSNHFVELQQVEEILDEDTASALGVTHGQLTLQFHGGGGMLASQIGRIFGRRIDYPVDVRAAMKVLKPWYHLGTSRSVAQMRERLALYFGEGFPPVARDSDEGQRLLLANAAATNYGFAFRMATYAALQQLAVSAFGGSPGRLVVDSPHNSVYEEDVDGESAVVHRHNACRAYPASRMPHGTTFASTGQALLLPGTNRTSSYLAVTGPDARSSLYSACHGAGTVISDFAARGWSGDDPQNRSTLEFGYSGAAPTAVRHLDDNGVNAALEVLVRNGLVRPVARMRPIAVLH
jgi:tRNA-splicing ligase RtcB